MTPAETKQLYESACKTKRMTSVQEEGAMWHKAFKGYEVADVRAALDAWWASTDRDSKGDLKSQWMPAPGELIAFVERAKQKRETSAAIPRDLVCFECQSCRYRCTSFPPRGTTPAINCRVCGNGMSVFCREAA